MRGILCSVTVAVAVAACGSSSHSSPPPGNDGSGGRGGTGGVGGSAAAGRFTGLGSEAGELEAGAGGDSGLADGGAATAGASDGGASDGGASDGGASDGGASDGGASDGGASDGGAGPGVEPSCTTKLLVGGADIATQGWLTVTQAPSALTYGADYVRLETSTNGAANSGGQLLVYYPGAFEPNQPFRVRIELLVEQVASHNALDSGAAILGSFTPTFGNPTDRAEMIYLDAAAVGWADDSKSVPFAVTDGAYHSYELSVDATGVAKLSIDGASLLTRVGYVSNGTLAIGDQTNDKKVDGAVRIRSVTRLCP